MRQGLSPKELEVVRLVADGKTNKQVALELERGVGTVKDHIAAACRKLDVNSRVELAKWYWKTYGVEA